MKFKTLEEVENYFEGKLPEDSGIIYINACLDSSGTEGEVFGFDIKDDCDIILGSFVKRWKSYYV